MQLKHLWMIMIALSLAALASACGDNSVEWRTGGEVAQTTRQEMSIAEFICAFDPAKIPLDTLTFMPEDDQWLTA